MSGERRQRRDGKAEKRRLQLVIIITCVIAYRHWNGLNRSIIADLPWLLEAADIPVCSWLRAALEGTLSFTQLMCQALELLWSQACQPMLPQPPCCHCLGAVFRWGWRQGWPAKESFLQMLRGKILKPFSLQTFVHFFKNVPLKCTLLPAPPFPHHKSLWWHSGSWTLIIHNIQREGDTEY